MEFFGKKKRSLCMVKKDSKNLFSSLFLWKSHESLVMFFSLDFLWKRLNFISLERSVFSYTCSVALLGCIKRYDSHIMILISYNRRETLHFSVHHPFSDVIESLSMV